MIIGAPRRDRGQSLSPFETSETAAALHTMRVSWSSHTKMSPSHRRGTLKGAPTVKSPKSHF